MRAGQGNLPAARLQSRIVGASRADLQDYYTLLGVPRSAGGEELRRAYRGLALRHHPDVAGDAGTAAFQRIAEAYGVLSDPEARAAYDAACQTNHGLASARPGSRPAAHAADHPSRSGPVAGRTVEEVFGLHRSRPAATTDNVILRGALDDLIARSLVRVGDDGVIEVFLTSQEARSGGTLVIEDVTVGITCPTCEGTAKPGQLWCRRCEHVGTVQDQVTVAVVVPRLVWDRAQFVVPVDPGGLTPPLRLRVRV